MKQIGMNRYRFQISWSRVQPDGEGNFNQAGIDFYSNLIDQLLAAGIKPIVALYHFDMPLNLAKKYNGFINKKVVDGFVQYGKKMIDEFGDRVDYWLTFNEQNLYILPEAYTLSGYLFGQQTEHELFQIFHNIALANTEIANYIHSKNKQLKMVLGLKKNGMVLQP